MPSRHRNAPRDLLTSAFARWQVLLIASLALGLLGGALVSRKPSDAVILCVVAIGIVGLAMSGERAFPLAITVVAVAPWYPFISEGAESPIVKQKVLCAALAAAPLAPWLWSLAISGRRARPSRAALLMGILYAGLTVLIFSTLGSVSALINSKIVGFLFLGVTFLCARRFGDGRGWLSAAFFGLVLLLLMGADAAVRAPGGRVGYFVGYPITYGALVIGLLPAAAIYALQRSRLLAGGLMAAAAALLILSESRSSWVAATVLLIVVLALQVRAGNVRGMVAIVSIVVALGVLIAGTGSLSGIVEQKLSSNITKTQSVTHREYSYGYAFHAIGREPLFGAGAPGSAALESANETNIGALDNGYLSISVDLGLVGLLAAIVPLGVAIRVIARCLRLGITPRYELALALGILGMSVVTIFYDSFYWAQIDLLLGAMGGVLSVRLASLAHTAAADDAAAIAGRQPRMARLTLRRSV
jgi:O-Antigen ligase